MSGRPIWKCNKPMEGGPSRSLSWSSDKSWRLAETPWNIFKIILPLILISETLSCKKTINSLARSRKIWRTSLVFVCLLVYARPYTKITTVSLAICQYHFTRTKSQPGNISCWSQCTTCGRNCSSKYRPIGSLWQNWLRSSVRMTRLWRKSWIFTWGKPVAVWELLVLESITWATRIRNWWNLTWCQWVLTAWATRFRVCTTHCISLGNP